jgi:hypothetical protein
MSLAGAVRVRQVRAVRQVIRELRVPARASFREVLSALESAGVELPGVSRPRLAAMCVQEMRPPAGELT